MHDLQNRITRAAVQVATEARDRGIAWIRDTNLQRKNKSQRRETFKSTCNRNKNSLTEGRHGSAKQSNVRQTGRVKNNQTFPSGTRETNNGGTRKRTRATQKRHDSQDKCGRRVTSMAFRSATQRIQHIDTTRVQEANTSTTEEKEQSQSPDEERETQSTSTPSSSSSFISSSTAINT